MNYKKIFSPAKITGLLAGIMCSTSAMAQKPSTDSMSNPLAQMLVIIIVSLVVVIGILVNVVNGATEVYRDKIRREKAIEKSNLQTLKALLILVFISVAGFPTKVVAQGMTTTDTPATVNNINGLSPFVFYLLIAVVVVEVLIIVALIFQLKFLMGIDRESITSASPRTSKALSWSKIWWEKLNAAKSVEHEEEIDMQHNYDGIRELDNKVPPWWQWAFAFSMIFAVVYLWRFHIAKSAPLQKEEYELVMQKAEQEKIEYLKLAGNKVDENTVVLLGEDGIAAGQSLFKQNCIACHGPEGQGAAVGPNLSDDYWIHGGKINDIFKSLKYGWQEKGMRSWKDDFSPVQMAQLSSYVKSLKGAKLANPREPQGELFIETATPDSTAKTTK